MYAPFRLPPLEAPQQRVFDPEIRVEDVDIVEFCPPCLVLRLEGERGYFKDETLSEYTFVFKGKFAAGADAKSLKAYRDNLDGQPLDISPAKHTFSAPTYVHGNRAQIYAGEAVTELLPHKTIVFGDVTYVLLKLECISKDMFDATYTLLHETNEHLERIG